MEGYLLIAVEEQIPFSSLIYRWQRWWGYDWRLDGTDA